MASRAGALRGLAAALVALAAFLAVALAVPGRTDAVRPLLAHEQVARHTAAAALDAGRRAAPRHPPGGSPAAPAGGSTTGSSSPPASTVAEIRANADWIVRSQLPDGAIATYVDRAHVAPYDSGYAALGLARAAAVTGDDGYLAAAWRFLAWYQAHEDANGYTTDYDVVNGVEASNGNMDSTDAYAGMFLAAADATWHVSRDRGRLARLAPGIAGALKAIESTQDADGLTWAKPSYHAKYAMDQAETYAGLRAAADLEQALGNASLSREAADAADRLEQGFAGLWEPAQQGFSPAVAGDGVHEPVDWSKLYPGALEEVWPVAFGLVTGDRAQAVVLHFAAAHPEWDSWYWPVAGWALQAVGLDSAAQAAATSIEAVAGRAGHAWPFTTATAGQLILLESGGFAG